MRIRNIILGIVGLVTIIGAFALVSNLIGTRDEEYKEVNVSYTLGGLDENGKVKDDEYSMYSELIDDFESVRITMDFDNQIEYQLFYYDENNVFLDSSEVMSANSVHNRETLGKSNFRIVIRTTDDTKLNFINKFKYANQLKVEVIAEKEVETLKLVIDTSYVPDEKFNKDSVEILYEDGMTWSEWLDSEYNTYGIEFDVDGVKLLDYFLFYHDESNTEHLVDPSDIILNSISYTFTV